MKLLHLAIYGFGGILDSSPNLIEYSLLVSANNAELAAEIHQQTITLETKEV